MDENTTADNNGSDITCYPGQPCDSTTTSGDEGGSSSVCLPGQSCENITSEDEGGRLPGQTDDINGNGVPDDQEENVAKKEVIIEGKPIVIAVEAETDSTGGEKPKVNITNVVAQKKTVELPGKKIELPYGEVGFEVQAQEGATIPIKLYFPYDERIVGYIKKVGEVWKVVPENFVTIEHNKERNQTIITLTLKDGGEFDDDGQVNGKIIDPGGPYIQQTQPVTVPLSPQAKGLLEILCQSDRIIYSKGKTHEREVRFK